MSHGFIKQIVTDAIHHALDKDVDWEEALLLAFDEPNHAGTKVIMEITRVADKAHIAAKGRWRLHLLDKRAAALLVLTDLYARIPDTTTEANRWQHARPLETCNEIFLKPKNGALMATTERRWPRLSLTSPPSWATSR